jgi:hypothetical protein
MTVRDAQAADIVNMEGQNGRGDERRRIESPSPSPSTATLPSQQEDAIHQHQPVSGPLGREASIDRHYRAAGAGWPMQRTSPSPLALQIHHGTRCPSVLCVGSNQVQACPPCHWAHGVVARADVLLRGRRCSVPLARLGDGRAVTQMSISATTGPERRTQRRHICLGAALEAWAKPLSADSTTSCHFQPSGEHIESPPPTYECGLLFRSRLRSSTLSAIVEARRQHLVTAH